MKRIFIILVSFCAFIGYISAQNIVEIDGIYYILDNNGEASVYSSQGLNGRERGKSDYSGNITIPENITYNNKSYTVIDILDGAFSGCPNLTSVSLPNTLKEIDSYSFVYCPKLTEITIPASVTFIDIGAFAYMSALIDINVDPENKKYCSVDGVLYNITKTILCSYPGGRTTPSKFPNELTTIRTYAFEGSKIEYIRIPDTVTKIREDAFFNCVNLYAVILSPNTSTIEEGTFSNCESLKSIIIPEGVSIIKEDAFSGSGLKAIDLPESLVSIKGRQFGAPLKTVISRSVTPPSVNFRIGDHERTLYVPLESIELYENTDSWGWFKAYLPLEDAPDISIDIPDNGDNKEPDNGDNNSVGTLEDFNDGSKIIYDFSGRKLSNVKDIKELTPGFYIINGKKYLLK